MGNLKFLTLDFDYFTVRSTIGGTDMKFEQIGVSTDWIAVLLALGLGILVKLGILTNIPW